jgi:lysozyme family protein
MGGFYFSGFLRNGGFSHAQTTGVYIDRTAGGNCYYCAVDGDIDAGTATGEETGQGCCVQK